MLSRPAWDRARKRQESTDMSNLGECIRSTSWQKCLFVGLGVRDLVDHNSHTALGDDVGAAVANLNADDGMCGIDAHHGEQVHNGVCAPTDHGPHLSSADLCGDGWVSLSSCGLCKTIEELVHNVQEEDHGNEPAHPTRGQVTGDNKLAIVAGGDHEGRANAKVPSLAAECCIVDLHHQKDLDQEQWHGQEPIHVTVGIVEGNAGQGWGLHLQCTVNNLSKRVVICSNPGVEDTDVVVCCNEGHQAGNEHSTLVFVGDSSGTEPKIHGRCHHARKSKGEAIVHSLVLQIGHHVHSHGCKTCSFPRRNCVKECN